MAIQTAATTVVVAGISICQGFVGIGDLGSIYTKIGKGHTGSAGALPRRASFVATNTRYTKARAAFTILAAGRA